MAAPTVPLPIPVPTDVHRPQFVDTKECRCALEVLDVQSANDPQTEAWRCSGNATQDLYIGTIGKWYMPENASKNITNDTMQPIWSNENPPATETPYVLHGTPNGDQFKPLRDLNDDQLSSLDKDCTGMNDTDASEKYYEAMTTQICAISKQAVPLPLMNSTAWEKQGCLAGFFCPNNSPKWPPMACPATPDCLLARITGGFCYPPMGKYEPQICEPGNYCPLGGKLQIKCPAGSFCPVGATEPTKCSVGASCPEGSDRSLTVLPFALLVVLNIVMAGALFATRWWTRRRNAKKRANNKRSSGLRGLAKGAASIVDLNQRHKRYHSLPDPENDIAMESRISSVKRQNTGFLAAVDNDWVYDENNGADEKPSSDMQLFVQSMSKCINGTSFGLSFEFENLRFQPGKKGKLILSDITGKIDSGALWAVMGASGAGKSTFVNVLMGKIKNTGGTTLVNSVPGKISKYKKIIGYVPQDDIVLPELTVRENILHSARIRLPSSWTATEIQHHVDVLLSCLQLSHIASSLVGSPAKPVISGGQRKRVSIGMELAAAPMALFLDEPTSGLDATSAGAIMETLKALSRLGITVVTIIHQPRQEIFASIDNLLLLGAGRMIYQGPTRDVAAYFGAVGFVFPEGINPADVLMDIIAGQGRLYKRIGETGIGALIEHWDARQRSLGRSAEGELAQSREDTLALRRSIKARGARLHKQVWFCLVRAMLQQYRSISSFYFEMGVGALAGFLIGLAQMSQRGVNFRGVFYPPFTYISSSTDFSSVAQMSLLVGVAIGLTASAPGVKVFGEEKLVFWREASSGHNRFAYYLGKVLSTFPRMLLANLHFTTMFLLLSTPKIGFGAAFVANFLYFYCIYGLSSIISVLTKREDGPLLAVMASLIVSVLNGMSPKLSQVDDWHLKWLWQLIPGTWLAEGYFTENVVPWRYLYVLDQVQESVGYELERFGLDLGMLFVLGTAYRVLAFLALRFLNRGRQI